MVHQADGGFLLNPGMTIGITLEGVTEAEARELADAMTATAEGRSPTGSGVRVAGHLLLRPGVRWRELDASIAQVRDEYEQSVERSRAACAEWSDLDDDAREDRLLEWREAAVGALAIRPYGLDAVVLERDAANRDNTAWAWCAAELMRHTFSAGWYDMRWVDRVASSTSPWRLRWRLIAMTDDRTCAYCRARDGSKFAPAERPRTPLHIGCRCCTGAFR